VECTPRRGGAVALVFTYDRLRVVISVILITAFTVLIIATEVQR
jgi:hypothetical protein